MGHEGGLQIAGMVDLPAVTCVSEELRKRLQIPPSPPVLPMLVYLNK